MKVIIPAKASSSRVPNKNFRPFWGQQSLLDLTLAKALRYVSAKDIYVSCEDLAYEAEIRRWGVNFCLREARLCDNYTPYADVVVQLCEKVPGEDDIMWCQVIDPLLDVHGECLETWATLGNEYDSLVVVYPQHHYMLDTNYRPQGFGFGLWHVPSQNLPVMYQLSFSLMIFPRDTIRRVHYHIGERPYWFHAKSPSIDIDTEADFRMAQAIYAYFQEVQS